MGGKTCAQLLLGTGVGMKPEWSGEAMLSWMSRNMHKFLRENPPACKRVVTLSAHLVDVIRAIPISDEYENEILGILRTQEPKIPPHRMMKFCDRLARHGKADLISEIHYGWLVDPDWVLKHLDKMGQEAQTRLVRNVLTYADHFSEDATRILADAIERLSPDGTMEVLGLKGRRTTPGIDHARLPKMLVDAAMRNLPIGAAKKLAKILRAKSRKRLFI